MQHRIAAVVLAAGASTRLGSCKQLLDYDGESLVARASASANAAGAYPVIVVVGADAEEVTRAVARFPFVRTVVNENWKTGIASSLGAGLSALDESVDAALVLLADQPFIEAVQLQRLVKTFSHECRIVAAAYSGTVGVPVVLAREFFADLMRLRGDHGAGQWLRSHPGELTCIPVPEAAADIDTPADAARLQLRGRAV